MRLKSINRTISGQMKRRELIQKIVVLQLIWFGIFFGCGGDRTITTSVKVTPEIVADTSYVSCCKKCGNCIEVQPIVVYHICHGDHP